MCHQGLLGEFRVSEVSNCEILGVVLGILTGKLGVSFALSMPSLRPTQKMRVHYFGIPLSFSVAVSDN